MNIFAFVALAAAALAFLLDWYVSTPRRFASIALGLFLLTVGLILVFVVRVDPQIVID